MKPFPAQLKKRGLGWPPASLAEREALSSADEPSGELAEDHLASKPVVLRKYRDIAAAMADKATLHAAGIKCCLYDDNLVRLDWFIANASVE